MQPRHSDREMYFQELVQTSRDFYIDYVRKFKDVKSGVKVLEVGCGEGGNLFPFAEEGCSVTGIDLSEAKIMLAKDFGIFKCINFFDLQCTEKYDIILIHDVIEHIDEKDKFMVHLKQFIAKDGVVFFGFPAWHMPFGGHQQMCRSRVCSKLPFLHLLPRSIYASVLRLFGESEGCVDELVGLTRSGVTIESFESLVDRCDFKVIDRYLWFINPHYQQKFNLKPRKLYNFISKIKYVRNLFTTACFYVIK